MINKIILTGFFVAIAYAQSPDELYSNALKDLESGNNYEKLSLEDLISFLN